MKNIYKTIKTRKLLLRFIILGSIGLLNNVVFANAKNSTHISEKDFVNSLNKNSVQFHEYENTKNLFDDFFGLPNLTNENNFNTNFQDLSLQVDSKILRDLYDEKLIEMTKRDQNIDKNTNDWSFFNNKI